MYAGGVVVGVRVVVVCVGVCGSGVVRGGGVVGGVVCAGGEVCGVVCVVWCGVVCGVVWCVVWCGVVCGVVCGVWCGVWCGVVRAGGMVCVDVCACMASSKERCTFLSIGATSSRALILLFRLLYYKLMNA